MLERTASWCHRHRWLVLSTWLIAAVALTFAAGAAAGAFADGGRLDGTDSQAAYDLLSKQFPSEAGDSANIVFHDDHGVAADRGVIEAYLAEVRALPRVADVGPPFQARAPGAPAQISADGTTAYATLSFTLDGEASIATTAKQIVDDAAQMRGDGVEV